MTKPEPVLVSWSGGKDSCMALHVLRQSPEYRVAGLLTTVRREDGRVNMHGVSRELVARQAEFLCLPITFAEVPAGAPNVIYEQVFANALAPHLALGIRTIAFGDLFLQDIRAYREQLVRRIGLTALFPVWLRPTRSFFDDFLTAGYRAVVVSVDPARLDPSFAGRWLDSAFAQDLPPDVDPCGENGEFHTFVSDGPGFSQPISLALGEPKFADAMCYCEPSCVAEKRG